MRLWGTRGTRTVTMRRRVLARPEQRLNEQQHGTPVLPALMVRSRHIFWNRRRCQWSMLFADLHQRCATTSHMPVPPWLLPP